MKFVNFFKEFLNQSFYMCFSIKFAKIFNKQLN